MKSCKLSKEQIDVRVTPCVLSVADDESKSTTPCVTTLNRPQSTVSHFDACDDSTSAKAWVHGQKTEAAGATPTKLAFKLSGTVCKGLSTAKM